MKEYRITYWYGIPESFLSRERLVEAVEDGFNLLTIAYSVENNKKALIWCEELGVKALLIDERVQKALENPDRMEEYVAAVVRDYQNAPALYAYYITDEPSAAQFPLLARIVAVFKRLDSAHPAYINLFPNYASAGQLGCDSYDEHLRLYMDTVQPELLSYDHYHLMTPEKSAEKVSISDPREAAIYAAAQKRKERAGFYDNLEAIRKYGLSYAVPYMLIVLLVEHGSYRFLRESEIAYEVYQSLAYGCSLLSYFTYWTPDIQGVWNYRNGIIAVDGSKCSHYYDVQRINREIMPIGRQIANTTSTAVFHVGEEKENVVPFSGYNGISAIEGGSFTVGFFADGTFLISNKDYDHDAEAVVTTEKALAVWDVDKCAFIPCGGTVTIRAGRGAYMQIL